jgi:hypothetical protein
MYPHPTIKKIGICFDPAHGKDVPGKRSPDSRLIEWKWSREKIKQCLNFFANFRYPGVDIFSHFLSFDNEPGIKVRFDMYNRISHEYDELIVIPLHNDAMTMGGKWQDKADHFKVFTSPGQDKSDLYANIFINTIEKILPGERISKQDWDDKDGDWEARLTLLVGYDNVKPNYNCVYIENLFMDNKKSVEKLLDEKWDKKHTDAICLSVMSIIKKSYTDWY